MICTRGSLHSNGSKTLLSRWELCGDCAAICTHKLETWAKKGNNLGPASHEHNETVRRLVWCAYTREWAVKSLKVT